MNVSIFDNLIDLNIAAFINTTPGDCTETEIKCYAPAQIASEVVIYFLGFFIICMAILKITTGSTQSLLSLNKYDLTLFKNQQNFQKNAIVGRRLFDNSTIIQHNLKALKDSGFDDKSLDRKSSMVGKRRKNNK